jgi:hypothetical protein
MSTQTNAVTARVRPSRSKAAIAERAALQAMSLVVAAAIESVIAGETFTFVGYATDKKGKGAVRYTNDKRRTRTLVRAGCTDVKFVELPAPMSKAEIDASEFIAQVMPVVAETAVA